MTTLQVGQTASPRSWMARCHCSSGPPVEQGQGLRGRQELPDALDVHAWPPSPRLGTRPTLKTRPVPRPRQLPPGAGWAPGAGTSLLTALVGAGPLFRTSSGTGPSCFLARWIRALSSALARPTRARGRGRCRLRARPPRVLGPTGARLVQASPLSPKVPEMEGCSPVNFLGVFCFLPDSGERTQRTRLWSNNHWEARAGWPLPPPCCHPLLSSYCASCAPHPPQAGTRGPWPSAPPCPPRLCCPEKGGCCWGLCSAGRLSSGLWWTGRTRRSPASPAWAGGGRHPGRLRPCREQGGKGREGPLWALLPLSCSRGHPTPPSRSPHTFSYRCSSPQPEELCSQTWSAAPSCRAACVC